MFKNVLNYLWEANESFRNEIYDGWNSNILKPMKDRYDASCDKIDNLLTHLAEYEALHMELNDTIASLKKTISNQKKELKSLNAKIKEYETPITSACPVEEPKDDDVMNTPIVGPGDGQAEPAVKSKKKKKK